MEGLLVIAVVAVIIWLINKIADLNPVKYRDGERIGRKEAAEYEKQALERKEEKIETLHRDALKADRVAIEAQIAVSIAIADACRIEAKTFEAVGGLVLKKHLRQWKDL